VEQRTEHVVPPVTAAGTDPAYIPGLTPPPRPAAPGRDGPDEVAAPGRGSPEGREEGREVVPGGREAEPAAVRNAARGAAGDVTGESVGVSGLFDEEAAGPEPDPEPDGGPVFDVADRRCGILVDHVGITLTLDGDAAEFRWSEIGAVEINTTRFGKRLGVTVYTTRRRVYEGDVEAPSRAVLKRWTAELDAVLDARFDEGEPEREADAAAEGDDAAESEDAGR
jgi:hypothetical protein